MGEEIFRGIPASPGISMSIAYVYSRSKTIVDISELSKKDIENELLDFEKAIQLSLKELKKIHSISTERIGEEKSKIFDVQIEILNDTLFLNQVKERIIKENKTAGFIFDNEISKIENVLMAGDEYMRERISDFTYERTDIRFY